MQEDISVMLCVLGNDLAFGSDRDLVGAEGKFNDRAPMNSACRTTLQSNWMWSGPKDVGLVPIHVELKLIIVEKAISFSVVDFVPVLLSSGNTCWVVECRMSFLPRAIRSARQRGMDKYRAQLYTGIPNLTLRYP
jgi:hypothetical protein